MTSPTSRPADDWLFKEDLEAPVYIHDQCSYCGCKGCPLSLTCNFCGERCVKIVSFPNFFTGDLTFQSVCTYLEDFNDTNGEPPF